MEKNYKIKGQLFKNLKLHNIINISGGFHSRLKGIEYFVFVFTGRSFVLFGCINDIL